MDTDLTTKGTKLKKWGTEVAPTAQKLQMANCRWHEPRRRDEHRDEKEKAESKKRKFE